MNADLRKRIDSHMLHFNFEFKYWIWCVTFNKDWKRGQFRCYVWHLQIVFKCFDDLFILNGQILGTISNTKICKANWYRRRSCETRDHRTIRAVNKYRNWLWTGCEDSMTQIGRFLLFAACSRHDRNSRIVRAMSDVKGHMSLGAGLIVKRKNVSSMYRL